MISVEAYIWAWLACSPSCFELNGNMSLIILYSYEVKRFMFCLFSILANLVCVLSDHLCFFYADSLLELIGCEGDVATSTSGYSKLCHHCVHFGYLAR